MMDDDDDFDFGPDTKSRVRKKVQKLEKVQPYIDELTKVLKKAGVEHAVFLALPSSNENGSFVPAHFISHMSNQSMIALCTALMRDKDYMMAFLLALISIKKGRSQFKSSAKLKSGSISKGMDELFGKKKNKLSDLFK